MKPGKREYEGATLTIGPPRALPPHMRGDILELSGLYTRPQFRRQGYANQLMLNVTLEADIARKLLLLAVEPTIGTDEGMLLQFYARHGFMPVQSTPTILMVRPHAGMKGQGNG